MDARQCEKRPFRLDMGGLGCAHSAFVLHHDWRMDSVQNQEKGVLQAVQNRVVGRFACGDFHVLGVLRFLLKAKNHKHNVGEVYDKGRD